ncbi:MAG: NAD(P)/FAD-dependent oxidoreductase [Methanomassiliicoccales archaeon]|nr:MAG: NAD(P)/FAD-dependent oxidoreductase [Methanomassiliicoccales archaeon]
MGQGLRLMHVVVIGTGGAGVSAIQTIRELDKKCKITAISKEEHMPYSPCSLPYLIGGEIKKKNIFRVGSDFYERNKVKPLLGKPVSKIAPKEKAVLVNGRKVKYDRLLVAAGSQPLRPPIPGIDLEGVFGLGNLADAEDILRWIKKGTKETVVLGAGFIGIECAIALQRLGLEVVVFEMLDSVLPKMLDKDMSLEVQRILEKEGIRFKLGKQVSEIVGNGKVKGVVSGKRRTSCDMVVLGIGVRPNTEFLKGSGIKTNFGILVDDHLRTSVKDIYAAGDIVEAEDKVRGSRMVNAIWPNAVDQGKIAGHNIAGVERQYEGLQSINILDVYGTPVLSIGMASFELKGPEVEKVKTNRSVKKMLIKDGRIAGVQMIGAIRNSGHLLSLVKKGIDVEEIRHHLLDDRYVDPALRS